MLERISGHRDGDATACPGDGLYAQLPQLRQMVTARPVLPLPSLTLTARSRTITYGSKATVTARLTAPGGAPVPLSPLAFQLLGRFASWSTLHMLTTDFSGAATTNVRLAYNHALRASFTGGPGIGGAQSKPLAIGVRPNVTAQLQPRPAAAGLPRGSRVTVRGTVRPAKRYALLLVDRAGANGKTRRAARRVVKVLRGSGVSSFRFTRAGSYVIRFATLPDARNAGGRSKAIQIRVR